ncbi:MAG: hypothetical protein RKP73_02525, partial [Candidatus Contendobacter sp.]|nr:hypothetical protein [Candidatus Contendobacter sp.]
MEWVMLGFLALAWLISPIILLIALVVARRQVRELRQRSVARSVPEPLHEPLPIHPTPSLGGGGRYGPADLENLLLLRLELRRLVDAGALEPERHRQLSDDLDRLWERHLRKGGVSPDGEAWRLRRMLAWSLLAQGVETPPGPPPWQPATLTPGPSPASGRGEQRALTPGPSPVSGRGEQRALTPGPSPASGRGEAALEPSEAPTAPAESQPPLPPPASVPARRRAPVESSPAPESVWEQAVPAADWRPAAPSPLEKALRALSGWPKLIAPFLAQNIGWFIGGFCFVAGALFLIANTTGFVNA